jgi:hypothetical protein
MTKQPKYFGVIKCLNDLNTMNNYIKWINDIL